MTLTGYLKAPDRHSHQPKLLGSLPQQIADWSISSWKLGQYICLVAFLPTIDVKLLNRAVQGSLLFFLRSPGMSD